MGFVFLLVDGDFDDDAVVVAGPLLLPPAGRDSDAPVVVRALEGRGCAALGGIFLYSSWTGASEVRKLMASQFQYFCESFMVNKQLEAKGITAA